MFSERAEGKWWVPRAKYIQETRGCQTENTSDAVPTPQPPCVLHAQTDRPLTSPVLSGLTCEVGGRCHARGWGHVGGGTWVWLVCPPWPPSLRPSVDGLSSWGPEGACGKMLLSIPGCEPCPPSAQRWLLQMPGGEGLPGMHGLGTEAVPSRAPGSGWSRSETVVTVQASELCWGSRRAVLPPLPCRPPCTPHSALIFVSVLHVKKLRLRSCPSPPASRRWSWTRRRAARGSAHAPGALAQNEGTGPPAPPPAANASFFLSAHAALWGVADILKVHPVSLRVRGLCSVCRGVQP